MGRVVRAPLELIDVPQLDTGTRGLRPSGVQDYPNGGGARAFLMTLAVDPEPLAWFFSDTGP